MNASIPDDITEQRELACALDECLAALDQARAEASARPDHPGDMDARRRLASLLERIGNLMGAQGDVAGGLVRISEGMAIREGLASADPGNARLARELAVSVENAGNLHAALGDYASALSFCKRTRSILRVLSAASPQDRSLAVGVLRETEKQAGLVHILGDLDQALSLRREAEAGWAALAAGDPGDTTAAQAGVTAAQQTATVLVTRGDLPEALAAYSRVLEALDATGVPDPERGHVLRRRAGIHMVMGAVRKQMGDPEGAAADFVRALGLYESLGPSQEWAGDVEELRALLASVKS